VLLYISIVTPLFVFALIPIVLFYIQSQRYYIKTSRELSRLESTSRSPIYALFSETLDGMSCIRAYGAEARYFSRSQSLLDQNQMAYFLNFSANCWLAVRLEFAGTLIVTFSALAAVLARDYYHSSEIVRGNFAGMAGLSLSFALSITQAINWSVRMASDLESQMVSVER
jgi:ATP-binding cassette, subfamily C (CFTR/MRP), member 1